MPENLGTHILSELFARRIIFVMGKGGVGKTTTAIALAFAAEAAGKRVLLAETGENRTIGDFFDIPELTETPIKVSKRIQAARIDPRAELEAYTHFHIKSGFLAHRITGSRLFDYLSEATPGLKEIMTLGRVWRWEVARLGDSGAPAYDLIIIDSPATGHALSLLRLPRSLSEMIRTGPIVSQIKDLLELLTDGNRTWLTLVTTPEELPVRESMELIARAPDETGIPVRLLFVNGVYPPLFTSRHASELETLLKEREDESGELEMIVTGARHQYRRRLIHERYIDEFHAKLSIPILEIPFFFVNRLSVKEIRRIADGLLSSDSFLQEPGHVE